MRAQISEEYQNLVCSKSKFVSNISGLVKMFVELKINF